ncbi:MAG: hypothetical protein ACYTGZ_22420, partial [Planctomycetota bacterium]
MRALRVLLVCLIATPVFAQEGDALGWPRLYEKPKFTWIAYQPQIESWKDYKQLEFQLALEFTPKGSEESTFSALTVKARTMTDFTQRTVEFQSMRIADLTFPSVDKTRAAEYRKAVKERLDQKGIVVSLDRLLAASEQADKVQGDVRVKTEAPPIYYTDKDAVLVQFTGEPTTEPIAGTKLRFAVNTNWTVIGVEGEVGEYLLLEDGWIHAENPAKGPWKAVDKLPAEFDMLPNDENWGEVRKLVPGKPVEKVPTVFVSLRPAELIETGGAPELEAIEGTGLSWVTNTDSDLFFHTSEKRWYFLVAGRWFRAPELTGRWEYVDKPPADFAKIPDIHERGDVLASVPGTDAAEEAVVQASIPRKANVKRQGTTVEVVYDGEPQWEDIEGAEGVAFAINTPNDVFRVEGRYYCVYNGVWFVASKPEGPWVPADKIPAAIYTIPGDHEKHNVVYVYIYESDEDEIVYGYTAGYYGCYVWRRRCYFGLGAWWGFRRGLRWHRWYHWRYRPTHYGYGCAARYSFHRGAWVRGGNKLYGPYGGVGRGANYLPKAKRYARGASAYGPRGQRYARQAYNPTTARYGARPKQNRKASSVYGAWGGNRVKARDDSWARSTGQKANAQATARTAKAAGRKNNVFVGRDG